MLLITGSPRSGTTRFAAYLQMMGQDIEGLWFHTRMPGGLEDGLVRQINKRLLEEGRGSDVDGLIQTFPRNVVKEPRFVSLNQPFLLETWADLRPDLRLLILTRDFTQVGHSLHNSPGIKPVGETPEQAAEIVRQGFEQFMSSVNRLGVPHERLSFPEFYREPGRVMRLLEGLGQLRLQPNPERISHYECALGSPMEVWEQWFDISKVRSHQQSAT